MVQQLAPGGGHQANRREEFTDCGKKRVGDGVAEVSPATGDGGPAATSLVPEGNGTSSVFFFFFPDSIPSKHLKKQCSDVEW